MIAKKVNADETDNLLFKRIVDAIKSAVPGIGDAQSIEVSTELGSHMIASTTINIKFVGSKLVHTEGSKE